MPRVITRTSSRDADLLEMSLRRSAGGGVTARLVFVEVDSEDGIPTGSRRRQFSHEDMTPTQLTTLMNTFNMVDARVKARFYGDSPAPIPTPVPLPEPERDPSDRDRS